MWLSLISLRAALFLCHIKEHGAGTIASEVAAETAESVPPTAQSKGYRKLVTSQAPAAGPLSRDGLPQSIKREATDFKLVDEKHMCRDVSILPWRIDQRDNKQIIGNIPGNARSICQQNFRSHSFLNTTVS